MPPPNFAARFAAAVGADNVAADSAARFAYAADNSRRAHPPDAVVFPKNEKEVAHIIRLANEFRIPIIPRGRGTGTAGGAIAEGGGVILSTERMTAIESVNADSQTIKAAPGALNIDVQKICAAHRLFWPPDPSSISYCSIGGNLATAAAGPRAIKYGGARNNVNSLRAVCGGGDAIAVGEEKDSIGGDLMRLLLGSEGTLGIITQATLKLSPIPKDKGGIVAQFESIADAANAAAELAALAELPSAIELMDKGAMALIRARDSSLALSDAGAMLLIEVDGEDISKQAADAAIICEKRKALSVERADDSASLWSARRALSPLLREVAPKKINEDVAVAVSRLAELLKGVESIAAKWRIKNINFGHAGDGNIHINLLFGGGGGGAANEEQRALNALSEIMDFVLQLGGTISGEHGIGIAKREFIPRQIDSSSLSAMRDIKRVFDPNNILNPGKIFCD